MTDPRIKSPFVLPNYPYKGRFTVEEVREALDRKDRLLQLLMDPVGPDGCVMNLPIDMMHILAFHLAYAGADTHTDGRQLIESRLTRDDSSMFEIYEWRPKGEFTEPAVVEEEDDATVAANRVRERLTPEVRAALASILLDELSAASPDPSRRQRDENVITEQKTMRGHL